MLKNKSSQSIKVMIIGAFLTGFTQAGYAQNVEVNDVDETDIVEFEVPENGEITLPDIDLSESGIDAGGVAGKCAVPGSCGDSGGSDRELSPSEEAEAIDSGWSN